MARINRGHISDLKGATSLVVDATVGVADLVENLHHTIQKARLPVGDSNTGNTAGLTGFIYQTIRGTTRLVGKGVEAGLAPVTAFLPEAGPNDRRDAVVSVLNGVYGDHLEQSGNPLAIEMSLRHQGNELDVTHPGFRSALKDDAGLPGKVMLFVHGLCLNDTHWSVEGRNRAEELAADLGYTAIYLRYNTGLPIASNGRVLADTLQTVSDSWPTTIDDIVVIGHSMGGLVARSACHFAGLSAHAWLQQLSSLVTIGTPHHGAPLEQGGNLIDAVMDKSPYLAPFTRLGKKRSAGINDLRQGSITDDSQVLVPLPKGVNCYAMAATLGKKRGVLAEHLVGDGLVPVKSALGTSKNPDRDLGVPESRQWVGFETGHLALLGSPGVYGQLRSWL